jgi:protein-S-isoprenylcysteine O-methyltransferase Ste14
VDFVDSSRPFAAFVLGALVCLGLIAVGRGAQLASRGVRILAVDRERTLAEGLADLGFVLAFLVWVYETVAFVVPLAFHLVPAPARTLVIDAPAARWTGALTLTAGLVVYGLALRSLGSSWRLGIDRDHPGPLVTGGIFARSRNPIYLGLALFTAGSALALGRLVLVLLALAFPIYLQHLIHREERFLAGSYGDAYREYAARVGRWWTWRGSGDRARRG